MSHIPPNGPQYYYPGAPAPPTGGYAYVPVPAPVMMPVYQAPPHHHPPPPHHPPPHHYQPPPHHPPPPHYPPPAHYPPPPPAPAPEPTQQPTYVTNYIYQQPPQPEPTVTVIEAPSPAIVVPKPWQAIAGIAETCLSEVNKIIGNNQQPTQQTTHVYSEEPVIDWAPATTSTAASFTHRAFVGGKEGWDSSPLWVIRAHHSGELVPGKLTVKQRAAYIPHGGREIPVHNFEILCAPQNSLRWVPASNGQVPVGAIPAGNSHNGEPLYIARCRHSRSSTPGKVHPSHCTAYISYGGSEFQYRNYEVLCKIVG